MRCVECSFWIAIDSADSRRCFYSNTNVSARRVANCEMCAGNDQFGKDPRLCYGDLSPGYSGRAGELLQEPRQGFIWFLTLKQQYKNNRLLTGACRHLSFSPHVACAPGVPRTFRLGRHRSAASCTLWTPIVLWYSLTPLVQTLETMAETKRRWAEEERSAADVKPKQQHTSPVAGVLASLPVIRIFR